MGEAFIVRRGGGGDNLKNAYALIAVEYPSGSVLTCSNGTKTFQAGNTYGVWLFGVPSAGTWVISCTNGTETVSENVVISTQYQYVKVALDYIPYFYKDGNEFTSLTGGWKVLAWRESSLSYGAKLPTLSKEDTYLDVTYQASSGGVLTHNTAVNLDGRNTLKINLDFVNGVASGFLKFGVNSYNTDAHYWQEGWIASTEIDARGAENNVTLSLNIASVGSTPRYILLAQEANFATHVRVNRIWAE